MSSAWRGANLSQPALAAVAVRKRLGELLKTDSELNAFCIDHFPEVYTLFSTGMDRLAKVNLLIVHATSAEIVHALRLFNAEGSALCEQRLLVAAAELPVLANPYRGLSAFSVEDADLFHGRQALVTKLWRAYQAMYEGTDVPRLLAIVGPSGSGKSSLARAGLLAALRAHPVPGPAPVRAIVIRAEQAFDALTRELLRLQGQTVPDEGHRKLREFLRTPDERGHHDGLRIFAAELANIDRSPLVVLVDQWEAIYGPGQDPRDRDAFVSVILDAVTHASRHVSIVLTLRSDFLNETNHHHPRLSQIISENAVLVPALDRESMRLAITEPARLAGRPLDESVVELLMTQMAGGEWGLPLLEFALTRLWDGLCAGHEPTRTLREIGDVGGALASRAQELYERCSLDERRIVQRVFVRLVNLGDGTRHTRRRTPVIELIGQGESEAQLLAVLRRFAAEQTRILTLASTDTPGRVTTAELTHESLIEHWQALGEWLEQSRQDRPFHDRLAAAAQLWDATDRPPGRLWRRPDLDLLQEYGKRVGRELTPLQEAFWRASRERYFAVKRARRRSIRRLERQVLSTYVEQGRQLLVSGDHLRALAWLNRAYQGGCRDSVLLTLLAMAMRPLDALQLTLRGHARPIESAVFSPDGTTVLTASWDTTAKLWDATSGKLLLSLDGHVAPVNSAVFSRDGSLILTAGDDCTAKLWESRTGRLLLSVNDKSSGDARSSRQYISRAIFSPSGTRFLTVNPNFAVKIWDSRDGDKPVHSLWHGGKVYSAVFSPDGNQIVTVGSGGTVKMWDTTSGEELRSLAGQLGDVVSAVFSPDGTKILTASKERRAILWDVGTGELLASFVGHGDAVNSAVFSENGHFVLTASDDHTTGLWDAHDGNPLAALEGHSDRVLSAVFHSDNRFIVTAGDDQTAKLWTISSKRAVWRADLLMSFEGHSHAVTTAVIAPNGGRVLTASKDATARIWTTNRATPVVRFEGHTWLLSSLAFSPDGRRVLTGCMDGTARLWDAQRGQQLATFRGCGKHVRTAVFSPDGNRILIAALHKSVTIWNASTYTRITDLELDTEDMPVSLASFCPRGSRILATCTDKKVHVFDAQSGKRLVSCVGHQDEICTAAFSPDGIRIVTSSRDRTAKLWDADTGTLFASLDRHEKRVNSAEFSPDGRLVLTSGDCTAKLWDSQTGTLRASLEGHEGEVYRALFSPDGKLILTAGSDRTIKLWAARTARLLATLGGHDDEVINAAYSPDGTRILVAGADDPVPKLWDVSPESRSRETLAALLCARLPFRFEGDALLTTQLESNQGRS